MAAHGTVYDKNGKNNLAGLVTLPWYYKALLRIRSWIKGNGMDALSRTEWLREMLKSVYAVVVVDRHVWRFDPCPDPISSRQYGQPAPESDLARYTRIDNYSAVVFPGGVLNEAMTGEGHPCLE
jgi:hypothetical protein